MKFTKMHGLGNDYIYVNGSEERVPNAPYLARVLSDRHTGVGADGLILIQPSERGDVRMEMYNADGSRGGMCGNGIRCVAKYAVEHGLASGPKVLIETDAGVRECDCAAVDGVIRGVRVDMGRPVLETKAIPALLPIPRIVDEPMTFDGERFEVTCVSMGNPHAVVFTEKLHTVALEVIGPRIEHAAVFPERINVHFARVDSTDRVTIRTWERGSGITRACGTGACAVCVAGALTNRTDRTITACLPGGELRIEWAENDHVYQSGPAEEVFTGEWLGNA